MRLIYLVDEVLTRKNTEKTAERFGAAIGEKSNPLRNQVYP